MTGVQTCALPIYYPLLFTAGTILNYCLETGVHYNGNSYDRALGNLTAPQPLDMSNLVSAVMSANAAIAPAVTAPESAPPPQVLLSEAIDKYMTEILANKNLQPDTFLEYEDAYTVT